VSDFDPHDPEEAYDRGYHKGYREGYREAMLAFMRAIEDGREGIASHHD
jgi:flagellar biosynthesis/type III secretory pathway protein FliH